MLRQKVAMRLPLLSSIGSADMPRFAIITAITAVLHAGSYAFATDQTTNERAKSDTNPTPTQSNDFDRSKTAISCPAGLGSLVKIDYGFEIDRSDRFICWYEITAEDKSQRAKIYPHIMKVEGRCDLSNVDEFSDYRGKGKGFVGGNHTCWGNGDRCKISCQPSAIDNSTPVQSSPSK